MFFILFDDEMIGHSGDVIADHAGRRFGLGFIAIIARQVGWILHPEAKEFLNDALRVFFF